MVVCCVSYLSNKQVSKSWIPAQFHTNVVDQHVKTYTRLVMANQLAGEVFFLIYVCSIDLSLS